MSCCSLTTPPDHVVPARTVAHAIVRRFGWLGPVHTYVLPLLILFGIVLSSAAQTEVAHHLTADIGYNQPYFTFYLSVLSSLS
jgi:hypothetical protein